MNEFSLRPRLFLLSFLIQHHYSFHHSLIIIFQLHIINIVIVIKVSAQAHDHRVTLRNTTMLPNIPGLPALLTLIFTPRAEFHADEHRTRLTGALCGLGYDPETNQSLFPEHDMEIAFDTEISLNVSISSADTNFIFFFFFFFFFFFCHHTGDHAINFDRF